MTNRLEQWLAVVVMECAPSARAPSTRCAMAATSATVAPDVQNIITGLGRTTSTSRGADLREHSLDLACPCALGCKVRSRTDVLADRAVHGQDCTSPFTIR